MRIRLAQRFLVMALAVPMGGVTHGEEPAAVVEALERATVLEVRGWGPTAQVGSSSAAYAMGQVVDMPQVSAVRTDTSGLSANGYLTSSAVISLPGSGAIFSAAVNDSANWVRVVSPPVGLVRDFSDGLATVGIACGEFHTLLLKRDGTVTGRGWDGLGQVTVPAGLTNVVAVACGLDHSVAVLDDGRAVLWGRNDFQQATVPEENNHGFVAAAAGLLHTILLRGDGTVHVTHPIFRPEAAGVGVIRDAVGVAAGATHSVVLRATGKVVSFGRGDAVLGLVPAEAEGAVAVAAGGYFSLALRADGRVVAWGDNRFGQCTVPMEATNVVAVAAGSFHAVALRRDGRVVAWGEGSNGALAVPTGLEGVVAVAAGGYHTQVLVRNGSGLGLPRAEGDDWAGDLYLPAGTRFAVERSVDLRNWTAGPELRAQPGQLTVRIGSRGEHGFMRLRTWVGMRGKTE